MNPTFQLLRIADGQPLDCVYVERPYEPLTRLPDPDDLARRDGPPTVRVPLHNWSFGTARARVGIVKMRMVPPEGYRGLESGLPEVIRVYYRGSDVAAMLGAMTLLKWEDQ